MTRFLLLGGLALTVGCSSPVTSSDAGDQCGASGQACCNGTACNAGLVCRTATCVQAAASDAGASDGGPATPVDGGACCGGAAVEITVGGMPATSVLPLTTVTLDGSESMASAGATITSYEWMLVSAPPNFQWTIMNAASVSATLYAAISGTYEVQLTTTDSHDLKTVASARFAVVPGAGIHVELTWDEPLGDLDLHYVGPGGTVFDNGSYQTATPVYPDDGDVFYIYSHQSFCGTTDLGSNGLPSPDWGMNDTIAPDGTTADDASLDVDQQCGSGPENVTQSHPFDASYEVMVHEWCSGNNETASAADAPITASIQVFFDGNMIWQGSQALTYDMVWDAATITVSSSGTGASVVPSTAALTSAGSKEGCEGGTVGGSLERLLPMKHRLPGAR